MPSGALEPRAPSATQACALLPGIVDYMMEQSGPPSEQILALKEVQELLKDGDDVIIIGVFKSESDPAYQLYQDAGEEGPQASALSPGLLGLLLLYKTPGRRFRPEEGSRLHVWEREVGDWFLVALTARE